VCRARPIVQDGQSARGSALARYRKRRSKTPHLPQGLKILTKFLGSVMDRDLTLRQQSLKFKVAHPGETASLPEGEPFLLEEREREFSLELRLTHVGCSEKFVRN